MKTIKTVSVSKSGKKAMVVITGNGQSKTLHLRKVGDAWVDSRGRRVEKIPSAGNVFEIA